MSKSEVRSEFCKHGTHESHYCGSCNKESYDSLKKENEELKKERDRYANAMKIALQEGIFFDKKSAFNRITEALKKD